jgi:hypothetical protein
MDRPLIGAEHKPARVADDVEPRGMKRTVIIIAATCSVGWSNAAPSDPTVLGAMQSFQDFCLTGDLSIEAVADVAKGRHYKLVVDRRIPGPKESTVVNKTWQISDITGDYALTVTQNDGLRPGRSFQCGVTLPKGTETNVEAALKDPSHFGVPDQNEVNVDGSRVVRWIRNFEWGTAAVSLTSQLPTLRGASMLNVLYRVEK